MPIYSEGRVLPAQSSGDRNIANASTAHCTAFSVLGEHSGTRSQAESYTELCHQKIEGARSGVTDMQEQVLFTFGRQDERRHFFDMVVTKASGERIAYTVKPEARLKSGRHVEEMRSIAWWVQKKGFAKSVRLLTEADIDRVTLHNANINTALRDTDPEAQAAARVVASGLRGAVPLNRLTQQVGLAARGYRALLRLVSAGELAPLHYEKITPETLVEWKGERQ
ncbi:hypothetical protein SAMN05421853_1182 [Roseivivax halotolerans]|uniref:TnsA endonuclease N-terminal domain-containing protein n=1 Tax=Roseivivax halotolerans TaxID=93684 RepID=A0A1I6AE67_9RHOB|nr:hypothetical protein [Roseivivax halotolerans]SFQ66955.1 hypothetical protein SAMN05421853_1182 [Roseivivax halotolerans]